MDPIPTNPDFWLRLLDTGVSAVFAFALLGIVFTKLSAIEKETTRLYTALESHLRNFDPLVHALADRLDDKDK